MRDARESSCGSFQTSEGVGDANELGKSLCDTNQDRKKWECFGETPYLRVLRPEDGVRGHLVGTLYTCVD